MDKGACVRESESEREIIQNEDDANPFLAWIKVCVMCECVCVRERKRERETDRERYYIMNAG